MELKEKINDIIKDLTNITDTIIIYNNTENNFVLEKINNNKEIKTKEFINNNKVLLDNLNKNIENTYREKIIEFIKTLDSKLNHCNFDILNNNITSIKIINKIPLLFGTSILAAYNALENKLYLKKKNYEKTIPHELLHVASSKKLDSYICSGFRYTNIKKLESFGTFINEGFTEYLNNEYFNYTDYYKINKTFTEIISIIIGKDLMEKMYFNADLVGLINEFIKYNNSLEDVIKFIINTDIIHKNLFKLSINKRIKLKKALLEVNKFLIHTYHEKVKIYAKDEYEIDFAMKIFISLLKTIKLDIGFNDRNIKEYKEKKLTL